MIKIFLLDDHEVVRQGVKAALEAEDDMVVVGEAGGAAEPPLVWRRDERVRRLQLGDVEAVVAERAAGRDEAALEVLQEVDARRGGPRVLHHDVLERLEKLPRGALDVGDDLHVAASL